MTEQSDPIGGYYLKAELSKSRDGTAEFQRFHAEHRGIVDYTLLVTQLVSRADDVVRIATKALYEHGIDSDISAEAYEERIKNGAGVMKVFRKHRNMFVQMIVCRCVDNYLCFVSDLLHAIFLARPESLKSSEQERLDFILQHQSFDELIAAIAEKRVHQLSYQGMDSIAAYFENRLGLTMFENDEERTAIIDLIQCRNLIVHNRGKVNALYVGKVASSKLTIGDVVDFDADELFMSIDRICAAGVHLEQAARTKFSLKAVDVTSESAADLKKDNSSPISQPSA